MKYKPLLFLKILVSVVRFRPWAPFPLIFKRLPDEWHEDCRESCLWGIGWFDGYLEQIFNIAKAETEPMIQPDRMADDCGRKTISVILGFCLIHAISLVDWPLS